MGGHPPPRHVMAHSGQLFSEATVKYWLKKRNSSSVEGPYTTAEIRAMLAEGSITYDGFECLAATGQTQGQLQRADDWAALASIVPEDVVARDALKASSKPRHMGNAAFLDSVRERSCYSTARSLHETLVVVAYCVIGAMAVASLFAMASSVPGGSFVGCAGLFFGLLAFVTISIERAIFNALLDMADVVIDIGRRTRDQLGSEPSQSAAHSPRPS
jgi:hypothetical protein